MLWWLGLNEEKTSMSYTILFEHTKPIVKKKPKARKWNYEERETKVRLIRERKLQVGGKKIFGFLTCNANMAKNKQSAADV